MNLIRSGLLTLATLAGATIAAEAATTPIICSGGGMPIEKIEIGWKITFLRAQQPTNDVIPQPGHCGLPTITFPDGSADTLTIRSDIKDALLLLAAAKGGGTFKVQATGENNSLAIKVIEVVNVVDSEPLSPGPDNEDEGDDVADADDGDDGGAGDEATDLPCGLPGDKGKVSIADPKLTKLNVRVEASLDAEIVGTIREGKTVTLAGMCETETSAGIVAQEQEDWCRISKPLAGCAMAKFIEVEGGAAGIAKRN